MSGGEDAAAFYKNLLELSFHREPEPLLERALALLVEISGAREAYLELHGDDAELRPWVASAGCDPGRVEAIRGVVSRGIIAETMRTGEVVATASALLDPRFRERGSVREHGIEAVLCAPIGEQEPIGVLYLQGAGAAQEFVPFSAALRERVGLFARALSPVAELMLRRRAEANAGRAARRGPFSGVVAVSQVMHELIARLALVGPLDVHVLLTGPSGAGKTALAKALHASSKRCANSFVEVNCAAIPETLLENELFGAVPGAHSGVPKEGVKGKVEAAEGGTLFLDEIAELSLSSQAKLLQLLQDRIYYRLGSSTARQAEVRIVTATNATLPVAVAERRFREDLYYRLKVFEVRVPPLSERPQDIVPLAVHFCERACDRHSLSVRTLAPSAIRALQSLEWPGNVRELAHRVESAALNAHLRQSRQIERRDVFGDESAPGEADVLGLQDATRRFQRKHVLGVLEGTGWNISEAAKQLDVARSYLYTLMRAHDLRPPR